MKNTKNREKRFLKIFWGIIIAPFAIIIFFLILIRMGAFGSLPTFEELESPKSNIATNVISEDGAIIGNFYIQNRSFVNYNELSPNIVNALVSTEDARFESHSGIDIIGLVRVGVKTILMGGKQGGGSTISQQLAKNLYPRDTSRYDSKIGRTSKVFIAKLKEWITAVMLERNYTKDEILTMYLNIVEYGSNAYGIKSASQTFFAKEPKDLTIEEAALLVGVVNAPTRYSPIRNPNNALNRRNLVIRRMVSNDVISKEHGDSIINIPINLKFNPISHNEGTSTYFRSMLSQYMTANEPQRRNYSTQWDYNRATELWKKDPIYGWCNKNNKSDGTPYNLYKDGLKIYTTINSKMQEFAENSLNNHLKNDLQKAFDRQSKNYKTIFYNITPEEKKQIIWSSIKNSDRYRELKRGGASDQEIKKNFDTPTKLTVFSYENTRGIDTIMKPMDSLMISKSILRSSFVAMEPSSGHVKAYVGGNNFRFFKYDMAMQGKRQVGSTIKPFIYTFAIDHLGISACAPVPNLPVTIDGWTPKEAGNPLQEGELHPLWWGLSRSRNNYSAWIIKQSNYNAVAELMHKVGINSYIDPVPSMCLGPSDISLYEMVNAFSTFVNMGVHVDPIFVTRIEDKYGNTIATFSPSSNDAISEQSAFTILEMLKKVTGAGGTGARVKWMYNLNGEIGGKTGTTDNNSDGWFIGVTPKLAAGVWVGGESRSTHLLDNSDGARLALPIFANFMKKVYEDTSLGVTMNDKFIRPAGAISIDCADDITIDEKEKKAKEETNHFFK